jgi:hypothetical protein
MTEPVMVMVPADLWPSVVTGMSGVPYMVEDVPNGERFVMMTPDDAQALLNGGFSDQRWKQANLRLAEALGALPKPEVGVTLPRLSRAHWSASDEHQ